MEPTTVEPKSVEPTPVDAKAGDSQPVEPAAMENWLFQYFKGVIPEVEKPEDVVVELLNGALVSVFKARVPNLDLLEEYPRFMKTLQGVVGALGRRDHRRYVIELETA